MSTLRSLLMVVGVLVFLAGVVFALQGAYGIGGGSVMDNNPFWIYAGAAVALVGFVFVLAGLRVRRGTEAQ